MQLIKITIVSLCVLFPITLSAQDTDYEVWSGVSAQFKAGKKMRFGIEQQARFNDTLSSFKNTFTAVSWKWKMSKRFALKTTYRFTVVPDRNNHGRISGDLIYSWSKKKSDLRIKNRLRYQRRSTFDSNKTASYIRNKLTFDYNASKLVDPYAAGEIFYRLDGKYEFRVWRFIGGLTWHINKKLDLKTYYQFEQEFNTKSNDRFHVFGVDLAWTIN